jgi:hypothetical protein
MVTTKSQIDTAEVREVRGAFDLWRSGKKHGREPIPPKLWRMAATLCKTHSVNRVARYLGLNHTALKAEANRRSPGNRRPGLPRRHHEPAFVELTRDQVSTGIISGSSSAEYVVEAPVHKDGTPRIHVRGANVSEVAALVRALRPDWPAVPAGRGMPLHPKGWPGRDSGEAA